MFTKLIRMGCEAAYTKAGTKWTIPVNSRLFETRKCYSGHSAAAKNFTPAF